MCRGKEESDVLRHEVIWLVAQLHLGELENVEAVRSSLGVCHVYFVLEALYFGQSMQIISFQSHCWLDTGMQPVKN